MLLASALAVYGEFRVSAVIYHATCIRPQSRPAGDRGELAEGPVVRVAFANLLYRNRDVRGILSELAAGEHDIVGLAEVTEAHLMEIDALLPTAKYPWRWCVPGGPQGLALMSRVPMDNVTKWMNRGHPQLEVTVRAPSSLPFRLLVIHTWGPVGRRKIGWWRAQLAEIADRAQGVSRACDKFTRRDGRRLQRHSPTPQFRPARGDGMERCRRPLLRRVAGNMAGEPVVAAAPVPDRSHPRGTRRLGPHQPRRAAPRQRSPASHRRADIAGGGTRLVREVGDAVFSLGALLSRQVCRRRFMPGAAQAAADGSLTSG